MIHYNIDKLIEEKKKMRTGDLYVSDLNRLMELTTTDENGQHEELISNVIFKAICVAWDAGYMAGYKRAKSEKKGKGNK